MGENTTYCKYLYHSSAFLNLCTNLELDPDTGIYPKFLSCGMLVEGNEWSPGTRTQRKGSV